MTRIGYGGLCPTCSEPVAVNDLLDQEVTRPTPMSKAHTKLTTPLHT